MAFAKMNCKVENNDICDQSKEDEEAINCGQNPIDIRRDGTVALL